MKTKSPPFCFALVAAMTVATHVGAQSFNPVPLTPGSYTHDIVVEKETLVGSPYDLTVTQGGGTGLGDNTFYEQGLRFGSDSGVPAHGTTFTNESNPNIHYTMPPDYTTNDCFFVDSELTYALAMFNTPTTVTNLSILGTGGGGAVNLTCTVYYEDNTFEFIDISFADWFNGADRAWTCNGRITAGGDYNNVDSDNPRLYYANITVSDASPVVGIDFQHSSGGRAGIYAISGNASGSTWTPISVYGYNENAIVPAILPPDVIPVTATMDRGTNFNYDDNMATWFERGYATPNGYPDSGLPPAGSLLTNVNNPDHVYQLASSYTANNATLIDTNHSTAVITPITPVNYTAFAVLTAGGNVGPGMTNEVVLQHANGNQQTNAFFAYDWYANNSQIAFRTGGRVNLKSRQLNTLSTGAPTNVNGNPKLFETVFQVNDTVSPVTNIVLKYKLANNENSTTYVLAVSASAGAVDPLIGSHTPYVNLYAGDTASFSASLVAGSEPLTYIWKKNGLVLSDGGKISGATTTNLVITGVDLSDVDTYTMTATNVAGSSETAAIPLRILSTDPDVTLPGDVVMGYQASTNANDWPGGEAPPMAIDDTTSKYLNGDIENGAVGFTVTPIQGDSVVTGLRLYAANDAPDRDPTSYTLEGSNDGVIWTLISSGAVNLPDARNAGGQDLSPTNQSLDEVSFANAVSYGAYRLSFATVKSSSPNLFQIGEVEFLGTLTPTPPGIFTDVSTNDIYNFEALTNTLSIVASGTPPYTYQWSLNGSPIAGATEASYSFPTLPGANTYSCTVSNGVNPPAVSSTATVLGLPVPEEFVVNFHYANAGQYAANTNEANADMWTNVTFTGLGAYPDATGNTNWNGFGQPNAYTPVFDASVSPQQASDGSLIPVTLTATYNFYLSRPFFYGDGSPANSCADCPSLILNTVAIAQGGQPDGTFTLHNVPPGYYSVYLYGKSWNNDRDTRFTVNSGTPHNGWNTCTNAANTNFATAFIEGETYVYFEGVTPTPGGTITGTFSGNGVTNAVSGLTGEGSFNGIQLIKTPAPPLLSITRSGPGSVTIEWTPAGGVLEEAAEVTGPYTPVAGSPASPYVVSPAEGTKFYRIAP